MAQDPSNTVNPYNNDNPYIDSTLMDAYLKFSPTEHKKYFEKHGSKQTTTAILQTMQQQPQTMQQQLQPGYHPMQMTPPASNPLELSLRVNGKGWNINIFQNQSAMEDFLCSNCNSVVYNAEELTCGPDDLYCDICLSQMISDSGGYCPVHSGTISHQNPFHHPSNYIRRKIFLKSIVICPHCNKNKNKCNQIVDTLGSDQKEGPYSNSSVTGGWKGSLKDLVNKHISDCIKKHNPTFLLSQKIIGLNKTINNQNNKIIKLMEKHSNELNRKNIQINGLNEQIKSLQNKLSEQYIEILQLRNQKINQSSAQNPPLSAKNPSSSMSNQQSIPNQTSVPNQLELSQPNPGQTRFPAPVSGGKYSEPCRYFQYGNCKRGNKCFYQHIPSTKSPSPQQNSVPQQHSYSPQPIPHTPPPPPIALAPLTSEMLKAAKPAERKRLIGERLFPKIQVVEPRLAGKITGMLLEMDNSELLVLLSEQRALMNKINEALTLLKDHQQKQSQQNPGSTKNPSTQNPGVGSQNN